METARIHVTLPKDVFNMLSDFVPLRQRSQFISTAVRHLLQEQMASRLAREYQEAAAETRRINTELEGTLHDGLD